MKTLVIYGSLRKQNTYHVTQHFLEALDSEIEEVFLPTALPKFCMGCGKCFLEGEALCPHREYVEPLEEKLLWADLIIITSPVYVMNVTGQVKTFLDHFGYMFQIHRPRPEMFKKQAFIISTTAGAGTNKAINTIKDSLRYWGVGHIESFGKAVYATQWTQVSDQRKADIEKALQKKAKEMQKRVGKVKPQLKTKQLFYQTRFLYRKHFLALPKDVAYWEEHDWISNKKPWGTAK